MHSSVNSLMTKLPFCALDKLVCDTSSNRFLILCTVCLLNKDTNDTLTSFEILAHFVLSSFYLNSNSSAIGHYLFSKSFVMTLKFSDKQLCSLFSQTRNSKSLDEWIWKMSPCTLLVLIITVDTKYSKTESTRTWPHCHIIYSRSFPLNLQSKWQLYARSPTSTRTSIEF
jgi:hypothetical protein